MSDEDRRLVYSTDGTLPLPAYGRAKPKGQPKAAAVPDDGIVRVGCERRRGGQVTLVYGLAANELERIAGELKRLCGTGGTAKDGIVTLQGDRRDTILGYLAKHGRRAKRMGG
jgi:translation initiation factor 1